MSLVYYLIDDDLGEEYIDELKNTYQASSKLNFTKISSFSESMKENCLVVVQYSSANLNLCRSYPGYFLFLVEQDEATFLKPLVELCNDEFSGIIGVADIKQPVELCFPMLNQFFSSSTSVEDEGQKKMHDMGKKLDELVSNSLTELHRVKKLHEHIVPLRSSKFKGVELFSKYFAGQSSGGDFFDVIESGGSVLLLLASTPSYVFSSVVLTNFIQLKERYRGVEQLDEFLDSCVAEMRSLSGNSIINDFEVLLANIDTSTLQIKGRIFGKIDVISEKARQVESNQFPVDKPFYEKAKFSFELERGERVLILSPGIHKNCDGIINGEEYIRFVQNNMGEQPKNLFNEIFFQLKKDVEGDFLKHDATVILLEVDTNVIHKI